MLTIKRALVSVSNKSGLSDFISHLVKMEIEIISTGGTASFLKTEGIPVLQISDYTGSPEILDGRVKTLHPKIFGGLLGKRNDPKHLMEMQKNMIEPIDMVVVNLYPFESVTAKEDCPFEEAIENIDIGGPSLLRAAAKNFPHVAVICDPTWYPVVLQELQKNHGTLSLETSQKLARSAFQHTARYDSLISSYLFKVEGVASSFPEILNLQLEKGQNLRYGENPHQKAAFYRDVQPPEGSLAKARQIQGQELSFNNILDLNACLDLVTEFEESAAVIIKHNNPCGVALDSSLLAAYNKARSCDPVSAFGGVLGFNRTLTADIADEIGKTFVEAVIAPGYDPEALAILSKNTKLRVMEFQLSSQIKNPAIYDMKRVLGGLLLQERDLLDLNERDLKVVTKRNPSEKEWGALRFAWKVVKHVKSNAIVCTTEQQTVGIGAGQMSRVDSVKIAAMKAQLPTKGTVLASDAFFPFRDGVDAAASMGVTAIIQPGGSVRDAEAIQAADEHGLAMVFTGVRHFKH